MVADACRRIERSEEEPSLAELAAAAGCSAGYFHRVFKAVTGLTPKDYAAAQRAARVRQGLEGGASVTVAIYDAGFNSSGRFYEKSTGMLGMTPTRYRAGGAHEEIRFAVGESSLGSILVASSQKGVASILFGDDPDALVRDLQDRFPKARLIGRDRDYEALRPRRRFRRGAGAHFDLPPTCAAPRSSNGSQALGTSGRPQFCCRDRGRHQRQRRPAPLPPPVLLTSCRRHSCHRVIGKTAPSRHAGRGRKRALLAARRRPVDPAL